MKYVALSLLCFIGYSVWTFLSMGTLSWVTLQKLYVIVDYITFVSKNFRMHIRSFISFFYLKNEKFGSGVWNALNVMSKYDSIICVAVVPRKQWIFVTLSMHLFFWYSLLLRRMQIKTRRFLKKYDIYYSRHFLNKSHYYGRKSRVNLVKLKE